MIDATFYRKVRVLLDKLDLVFEQDWATTKHNLDPSVIQNFVDPDASFLEPEGLNTHGQWASRDELLTAYNSVVVALMKLENSGKIASAPVSAQPAQGSAPQQAAPAQPQPAAIPPASQHSTPISVYPAASAQADLADRAPAQPVQQPAPAAQQPAAMDVQALAQQALAQQSAPSAAATPVAPSNGASPALAPSNSPKPSIPSGMPMPKPGTGPQGFPKFGGAKLTGLQPIKPVKAASTPVSEQAAEEKEKAALAANTGKVLFSSDDGKSAEQEVRKKFAHLLDGVKSETIRDFVLAEGTHTGTGKPSMIIYIPDKIWLEFAFDFAEGQRILNKYPQRDPELIEFMRSSGHKTE
ncbi:hypothetical protein Rhal01_03015 [Rubritalea halochordaticola]|uniref:Uncharacterized protein n=1 Tax=Rubritalea halochordaticola TaxID=714537 RepID=A0ABP9V2C4_9BACT